MKVMLIAWTEIKSKERVSEDPREQEHHCCLKSPHWHHSWLHYFLLVRDSPVCLSTQRSETEGEAQGEVSPPTIPAASLRIAPAFADLG